MVFAVAGRAPAQRVERARDGPRIAARLHRLERGDLLVRERVVDVESLDRRLVLHLEAR